MNQKIKFLVIFFMISSMYGTIPSMSYAETSNEKIKNKVSSSKDSAFTFDVNPETSEIFVEKDGVKENASLSLPEKKVVNLKKNDNFISWSYPDDQIDVQIEKKESYLNIKLKSTKSEGANEFTWPKVSAESYTLPLWEGKNIPSDNPDWKQYLKDEDFSFKESFSMRFFALNKAKYSIMYIADHMYNNNIRFNTDSNIQFSFTHKYPSINKNKEYGFRLYITDKNPVSMANIYKNYIKETGEFKTLAEKEKTNPNIRKLYGAPHIYFWNHPGISIENIKWDKFTRKMDEPLTNWIAQLLQQHLKDSSADFENVMHDISKQTSINKSQQKVIVNAINQILTLEQLYNKDIFSNPDAQTNELLKKGIQNLSEQELYTLNKGLIKSKLTDAVDEVSAWEQKESTDVLHDMQKSGIKKAWVGLPNWANGLMNPQMVEEANKLGYLIGPYDSYHSIHEVGNRDWNTAAFKDKTLYEKATIANEKGVKIRGFAGKGRKLNPTLALPSVKQRVNDILQNNIPFNSWFVDCDATGEIYDDYSPDHTTTQEQDVTARLQRMKYISEEKHMVVGSEGGNDFASNIIAFAHGIETPGIWPDSDMKDKQSPYYVGSYKSSSPDGAIPELNGKTIPIKPIYKNIYNNPVYSVPLYKLVYNDSIITTHQWGWGSFRIKDEIGNRMLSEMLYNVPPLYNIDKNEWKKNKSFITSYLKVWSPFHEKAVTKPMTNFEVLSEDRQVQCTTFGNDMKVIVNFSNQDFKYNEEKIKAKTAVIYDGNLKKVLDVSKADSTGQINSLTETEATDLPSPNVDTVTDQDTKVTGTGERGSKVSVVVDGKEIGSGAVDEKGNYTVDITKQPGGKEVVVTVTDPSGNTSQPTKIQVKIDSAIQGKLVKEAKQATDQLFTDSSQARYSHDYTTLRAGAIQVHVKQQHITETEGKVRQISDGSKEKSALQKEIERVQKLLKERESEQDGNLVRNGLFDSKLDNWKSWKGSVATAPEVQSDGRKSANVVKVHPNSSVEQVVTGLEPSTSYELTTYAKVENGEKVSIGVKNTGTANVTVPIFSKEYSQAKLRFKTGPNATTATIYVYKSSGTKPGYADVVIAKKAIGE
ncbi:glycoside hydrolase [Bacillus cereus]|uniref:glycoside hydrolase n=1 Tax=Bacillus cereus TaxID=1396 RepID=UPI000279D542|nr:glycoside hydrolase [Bacillus cereus]EJR89763.1 hypothetical protein IKG_05991 [Bacillus cereus VD200]